MRGALLGSLLVVCVGCSGSDDGLSKPSKDAGSPDAQAGDGQADGAGSDAGGADAAAEGGAPTVLLPRSSILATELAV
jgi:hypothetical protein